MKRTDELLGEILEELKNFHAYVVQRDKRLDSEDAEDRERKMRNDELMLKSIAMQQEGVEIAKGLAFQPVAPPKPPEGKAS
jgi:hypothetical protein